MDPDVLRVGGRALLDESSGARFEGLAVVGGVPSAFAAQYYEHAALLRESVQKFVGDDTQRSVEFDLDVRGQGYTAGLRVRGDAAAPDVSLRLRLRKGRFRCVGLSFVARGARPFEEDFMSTVGGRAAAPEALGTVVPVLWVETGEGRRAATADEAAAVDAAAAVAPALCATLAPDAGPVSESVVAYARGFEARRPESARGSAIATLDVERPRTTASPRDRAALDRPRPPKGSPRRATTATPRQRRRKLSENRVAAKATARPAAAARAFGGEHNVAAAATWSSLGRGRVPKSRLVLPALRSQLVLQHKRSRQAAVAP